MNRFRFTRPLASFLTLAAFAFSFALSSPTSVRAQGLVSCAASAGALGGTYVTVNSDQAQVNVRSGPNSYLYDKVGILLTFESAPALGRSPGGDWIQISCPAAYGGSGWVYAANVTLTASADLPVVAIPVTVTPEVTSTIDPALAAAFPPVQPTVARLPTFTPAASQPIPVFTETPVQPLENNFNGILIIAVAALGAIILLASFFIRR
ncbi:MAG: hypothetical protein HY867_18210 [Chloroflexi bacterium]|nr:hypothetical protein [Chloroflexota bacterium]